MDNEFPIGLALFFNDNEYSQAAAFCSDFNLDWALHFQEKLKGILVLHRIDSSKEDGSFERLINDNHLTPNLVPKLVEVDGTSYPVFFAKKDIDVGEELTYSYGPGDGCNYLLVEETSDDSDFDDDNLSDIFPVLCNRVVASSDEPDRIAWSTDEQTDSNSEGHGDNTSGKCTIRDTPSSDIMVQSIDKLVRTKIDYGKIHACFYCGEQEKKISRHLQTQHCEEMEIASLPELPANRKKGNQGLKSENQKLIEKSRRRILDKVRNMGDFKHNIEVIQKKKGVLLVL
ncbi:uncharacterized protein LOC110454162 [Mizuhopecten yessoensis]|uniref:uncharacterized protein LOC110454162 n=1 Tax=Mizuhopecten yessoensis TaxID=6573 RepID=UPI000B457F1B|nr:uncharacterized protein LOC110454162 [Mizuhopecten yessoensis]